MLLKEVVEARKSGLEFHEAIREAALSGRFRAPAGASVTAWAEAEERWAFDRWVSDEPSINNSRSNPLIFRANIYEAYSHLQAPLREGRVRDAEDRLARPNQLP